LDLPPLRSKNTIVTPHVAFATAESMKARCEIVFNSLQQWMNGNQINVIL
jgi:D-3-phosphoglycerate dehydrogenase